MSLRRMGRHGSHMISEVVDGFDVDLHVDPSGLSSLVDVLADRIRARLAGDSATPPPEIPDVRIARARVYLLEEDER